MLKWLKRSWYKVFPPEKLEIPQPTGRWLEGITPEKLQRIYREVFNTAAGKIILADLEAKYHNRSTIIEGANGSIDPLDMAVREGARRLLLRIKTLSKEE